MSEDGSGSSDISSESSHGGLDDESVPVMWSATSDRGSNVKKGMSDLLADDEEDDAINDWNACMCHLVKGVVDCLCEGKDEGTAQFSQDCTVMLGVSAVSQRAGQFRGFVRANAAPDVAHLVAKRKGETRWEGLYDVLSTGDKMKSGYCNVCKDASARTGLLQAAGIADTDSTDFPEDSFWSRIQFYHESMLLPLRKFSKWAQHENAPCMMFLREEIDRLLNQFAPDGGDDDNAAALRRAFRNRLATMLEPDAGDKAPLMLRAAFLNPLVDISKFASDEQQKAYEEVLLDEMTAFCSTAERRESGDLLMAQLKLELAQFQIDQKLFMRDIEQKVLVELQFKEKAEYLKRFFSEYSSKWKHLKYVCKAYYSMPVASSKSETTFSYTGELITKKRNGLSVELSEASTVSYDMTRQENYNFTTDVMGGMRILAEEYEIVKRRKLEEKAKRRDELIRDLNELDRDDD